MPTNQFDSTHVTLTLHDVMKQLSEAPTGLGRFAKALKIQKPKWRASVAALLGVPNKKHAPVAALALDVRTTLLTDVDPDDRCFLIFSGRFDEYRLSVRAAIRLQGDLVGYMPLLSPLDDPFLNKSAYQRASPKRTSVDHLDNPTASSHMAPREGSEVRTAVPTVVIAVDGKRFRERLETDPILARVMLHYMAEHGGDYLDDQHQYDEAFEQYFPGRSGMLTPPPYDVRAANMRIFFCKKPTDPHLLKELLPPGSHWLPGCDFYLLVCTQMRGIAPQYSLEASFDYDEVAVFVPSLHLPWPSVFFHVPAMFPDNIMAIYMGREILGLPKRRSANFCEEFVDSDEGLWRFLMRRMLSKQARERQTSLSVHKPKQVDVLDARWRVVKPADEEARLIELVQAMLGELLPEVVADKLEGPFGELFGEVLTQSDKLEGDGPLLSKLADRLNRLLPKLPAGLRSIQATAWKRIFAPEVENDSDGEQRWKRKDFEVDGIVATPFPIKKIHKLELIDASEEHGGGVFSNNGFVIPDVELISPIGIHASVHMGLNPGRELHNYRIDPFTLTRKRRNRLAWGPHGCDADEAPDKTGAR
ncbi:MAG: hypothetical protein KC502_02390 [Myxococcales bacterium]|nr:hypothetical protein [Myxococcales bacterium]